MATTKCNFCQKPLEDSAQECLYCGAIFSSKLFSNRTFISESEIDARIDADIERRFGEGDIVFDGKHGILFKRPLRITKSETILGDKAIIHKNITAVSFNIFHPVPSNTFLVQTHINLCDGNKRLKINVSSNNKTPFISDDLIGAFWVLVGTRIFYNMILAFDSSKDVNLCGYKINRDGIFCSAKFGKTKHVKWSDYCGMKHVNEKIIMLMAKDTGGRVNSFGKFDLRWLNSEYFRDLMPIFCKKVIPQMKVETGYV